MLFREYRSKNVGVVVLRWGFLTYAIGIADQPKYQLINIRCTSLDMQADVAEGLYGKQFYYYFTKKEIEELIEGKTIEKPIHEDITYDEVYQTMDNLWNFMYFTGYFRKVSERVDVADTHYVELSIPNREVKYIFRTKVLGWFDEKVKARDRSRLFTALINLDVEIVEEEIVDMLLVQRIINNW